MYNIHIRGVGGGWVGWAIAHPDFGRIGGAAPPGSGGGARTTLCTTCPPRFRKLLTPLITMI